MQYQNSFIINSIRGSKLQFEKIYNFKRILLLLKQISKDEIFIHTTNSSKGINFSTINKERTILLDVFLQKEETITNNSKENNLPKKFDLKTGKLFYDIMDAVENGSNVNLEFEGNDLNINIIYEDIKLNSILNATSENFIGFPLINKKTMFKVSGEKIAHALNLFSKFKNDLEVKIKKDNLIIESTSIMGSTKLTMPAKISKIEKNEAKESVYDYEIIKPLLSGSKLSNNVEVMFNWNKNIGDNVLIAKCNFKDYDGYAKYLFTPKGVLDGIS